MQNRQRSPKKLGFPSVFGGFGVFLGLTGIPKRRLFAASVGDADAIREFSPFDGLFASRQFKDQKDTLT